MFRVFQVVFGSLLFVAMTGCATTGKQGCGPSCQQACCADGSGSQAQIAFCPKTVMLTGLSGKVHDKGCNKDMDAGAYCEKCNRFMVPGTVHCEKCGKDMPKGKYCGGCKQYMGVASIVSYCEHCKAPYATDKGCPRCKGGK